MNSVGRRLPLVLADEQLTQSAPPIFEKLVRRARPGSDEHRGTLRVVRALLLETARKTLPPSLFGELSEALAPLALYCAQGSDTQVLRSARSLLYSKLGEFDERLLTILRKSGLGLHSEGDSLGQHAEHVTLRYASLAGYFTWAASCHALDGANEPELLLESLKDQLGARTYLRTGLGAARNPEFLARARAQADFELGRPSELGFPSRDMLALEIFHEFLGARYRAIASEERAHIDAFLIWTSQPFQA